MKLKLFLVLVAGFVFFQNGSPVLAVLPLFHRAPPEVVKLQNPFSASNSSVVASGEKLFSNNCASCHGKNAMGTGDIPSLAQGPSQSVSEGELFWFIGKGSIENGMPPSTLATKEKWQVVTFIKSLNGKPNAVNGSASGATAATSAGAAGTTMAVTEKDAKLPAPQSPFTDFRFEKPGKVHKITPADLPKPGRETSAENGPDIVPRPPNAWPQVPPDFRVQLFASGLENPRLMRVAPNGDVFLAESEANKIKILRGITADGKAKSVEVFAKDIYRPYGIAFYPPGPNPKWIYVGDTDAVLRFPYKVGDLKARGKPEKVIDLPDDHRGHWTRDLQFSLDGKKLFVAVGSASNVDDPDTSPREKNRADILVINPDGTRMKVYAYGIRNAGGGLAVHPQSGVLWCSTNERDGLGDDLVPDYITHVQEGGYYGWPWWYIGQNQDPRLQGTHPELKSKLIEPDVLLQPHHASLQLMFYGGAQFPKEYRGDIFSSQHGSWNRAVRTGYEVVRVPMHGEKADGSYEDFMTGFVVDNGHVWGRPVGITMASDGTLLVSDDGSNSIWRISYIGK